MEYVEWQEKFKDLSFIPNARPDRVISIDDREEYIKPDQRKNWLYIPEYDYPYTEDDFELNKIIGKLSRVNYPV